MWPPNLDQDNWQMDIIATDIHGSNGGFMNADGSMIYFSEQTDYLTSNGGALNRDDVLLSTSDLDGNGLSDIILTDGIRVHAYYNLDQDNWQMDIIATDIHGSNGGFMNADGSMIYFSEQTDYLTSNGGALNRDDVLLSTSDLDGNGLNDIILTDGIRVHAYYNLGNNTPQITSLSNTYIEENTSTDTIIYDADATDPDGDALTYSVTGTDASYVEIDEDDGEVRLLNPADYETKDSYTFDITVSDGELSDTQTVTVNVTDVDEVPNDPPEIDGRGFIMLNENTSSDTVLSTYTATDPMMIP